MVTCKCWWWTTPQPTRRMMGDTVREAIGAAVAPYLVDGQEQDVGIADAVVNAIPSLPLPVILKELGIEYRVVRRPVPGCAHYDFQDDDCIEGADCSCAR